MIRILMIFAGILLVGSGALTRFLDSAGAPSATKAAVARADTPREQSASGRSMMLDSGRDAARVGRAERHRIGHEIFFSQCVDRYCELANIKRETLKKADTPFLDETKLDQ